LILDAETVRGLLDPDALIEALAPAMESLSRGEVSLPPRIAAMIEKRSAYLGAMPVYLKEPEILAAIIISVFPENDPKKYYTHYAIILLFNPKFGELLAMLDGGDITAARTAAGSAFATKLLALEDAKTLTIIGNGVQAKSHAFALNRIRDLSMIQIAGRDPAKADQLARELDIKLEVTVSANASIEQAVRAADIICAATHAAAPVLEWSWIKPGVHINSVGVNPSGREIDGGTVQNTRVFVEAASSALSSPPGGANELLWPIRDGLITEDHVCGEIGAVSSGAIVRRRDDSEVTLYKSVGVGVQDAVAADLVYRQAIAKGLGVSLEN
ncbi:MAG: ornithine cyclodeaminase family protein, partial [Rhodospirillales bacterium]|nr:ornithine cyclodeaminase family protein [Rhodospirillales bacterium]